MQIANSRIDPTWLAEMMRLNPPSKLPNGNIFSGPVRLSFPNILAPSKDKIENGVTTKGTYNCAVLFPPGADMSVFVNEWNTIAAKEFAEHYDAANQRFVGLEPCFHKQDDKAFGPKKIDGYTVGAWYFNTSTRFKPPCVDSAQNPIIDASRVYPGVWAFLAFNTYSYKNKKKGVSFGLQTVMIIADDEKLGGAGGDPKKDFEAVKISANTNGAAMFSGMPGGGHVGTPGTLPTQPLPGSPTPDDDLASLQ